MVQKQKRATKICNCGCPQQWHWGCPPIKHCTECNCKQFTLHHIESYGYRRNKQKLYAGKK